MNEAQLMTKIENLYLEDPENFLLIEIGANDGYCCDRMHKFVLKHDPKSIMVEPIKGYFEKLKQNYQHLKNINYENIALDNKEGTVAMTYIPRERIVNEEVRFRMDDTPQLWKEHWAGGLGSFYTDKNNLGCPELQQYQETIEVETKTFDFLFKKYNIQSYKNVVLQTDCEGHDLVLMKSFPFHLKTPTIYISEIYHATRYPPSHPNFNTNKGLYTEEDENEAKSILSKQGYDLHRSGDLIGVLRG